MTAALSALAFLKGHWRLLGVGVLLVAIGFLWLRLEAVGAERDAAIARLHAEQAAHAVTRQSVSACQHALDQQSQAVANWQARGEQARKAAENALSKAQARERALSGVIDRLERSGAQRGLNQAAGLCEASDAVEAAWPAH